MSYQGLLDDLDAWATVQPKAAKAIRQLQAENERLRQVHRADQAARTSQGFQLVRLIAHRRIYQPKDAR